MQMWVIAMPAARAWERRAAVRLPSWLRWQRQLMMEEGTG